MLYILLLCYYKYTTLFVKFELCTTWPVKYAWFIYICALVPLISTIVNRMTLLFSGVSCFVELCVFPELVWCMCIRRCISQLLSNIGFCVYSLLQRVVDSTLSRWILKTVCSCVKGECSNVYVMLLHLKVLFTLFIKYNLRTWRLKDKDL